MASKHTEAVRAEVAAKLEELKTTVSDNNMIAAAQFMCGTAFLPIESDLVRERMLTMAAVIVGALALTDEKIEKEATNG